MDGRSYSELTEFLLTSARREVGPLLTAKEARTAGLAMKVCSEGIATSTPPVGWLIYKGEALADDPFVSAGRTPLTEADERYGFRAVEVFASPGIDVAALREVADVLMDQSTEPCWFSGNYAERMNYWRDKAIEAASTLRHLAAPHTEDQSNG